jgi:hypothetical protein
MNQSQLIHKPIFIFKKLQNMKTSSSNFLLTAILCLFMFSLFAQAPKPAVKLIPYQNYTSKLWGYRDSASYKTVVEPKYQVARKFAEDLSAAKNGNQWYFIDRYGIEAIKVPDCDTIGNFLNGFAKIEKDKKVGCLDKKGNMVIPMIYSQVGPFIDGRAVIVKGDLSVLQKGGSVTLGFVDKTGKEIFNVDGQDLQYPSSGLSVYASGNKYGYLDLAGKLVIPCKFDYAENFVGSGAIVATNGKGGIINNTGNYTVEPQYDYLSFVSSKFIAVFNGQLNNEGLPAAGKYGIIDKTGKFVLPQLYDQMGANSGIVFLIQNQKCGIADTLTGKILVPCEMEFIPRFNEGIAYYQKGGKYGYIKEGGKILTQPLYETADDFSGGLSKVRQAGKTGFVNKAGVLLIPCIYGYAEGPFNGLWMVEKGSKYGFVSSKGLIIPCLYDMALYQDNDMILVQKAGKEGLFDRNGKPLLECTYDRIDKFVSRMGYGSTSDMIARVQKGGKWGVVDSKGKLIIPVVYDDVMVQDFYNYESDAIKVKKGELWGTANLKGELITPCEYETIYAYQSGMCKVRKTVDGELVAGFLNRDGKLAFAGLKWYMVKDYFTQDFVEYDLGLEVVRIDKQGVYKSYKRKDSDKWIDLENGKKLKNTW